MWRPGVDHQRAGETELTHLDRGHVVQLDAQDTESIQSAVEAGLQAFGRIVNISSKGGKVTFPLGTLYHGSKLAVEGLFKALHYELAAFGVRVKIIEPRAIHTDFAGRSLDFSNESSLEEYQPAVQSLMADVDEWNARAIPETTALGNLLPEIWPRLTPILVPPEVRQWFAERFQPESLSEHHRERWRTERTSGTRSSR